MLVYFSVRMLLIKLFQPCLIDKENMVTTNSWSVNWQILSMALSLHPYEIFIISTFKSYLDSHSPNSMKKNKDQQNV